MPQPPTPIDLVDMPIAALNDAVAKSTASVSSIRVNLPNPTRLTTTERKHTGGKLRNGESAVLQIIATVAADPTYAPLVKSLGDRDFGVDPTAFEPALLQERLQRVDAITPLALALEGLAQDLNDTVLDLQELSAQPLRDAYAILKNISGSDPTLRARIKDAIDFYAKIGQAAAETRKANKAAKAAVVVPPKA